LAHCVLEKNDSDVNKKMERSKSGSKMELNSGGWLNFGTIFVVCFGSGVIGSGTSEESRLH
jgi:hypothetical protein